MERHVLFMDYKMQRYKDVNSPQVMRLNRITFKTLEIFVSIDKLILKFIWKQRSENI